MGHFGMASRTIYGARGSLSTSDLSRRRDCNQSLAGMLSCSNVVAVVSEVEVGERLVGLSGRSEAINRNVRPVRLISVSSESDMRDSVADSDTAPFIIEVRSGSVWS